MLSSKRALLSLSHAMERTLRPGSPHAAAKESLVIGLFQRRGYFDIEAQRYAAMAASGTVCVVGFVGDAAGLPDGVHGVALRVEEGLAAEWALVVLDGSTGSALVAHDTGALVGGERTLEAAREFDARWTFHPRSAAAEADRILGAISERLPQDASDAARSVIAQLLTAEQDPTVGRLIDVTEQLVVQVDHAHQRATRIQARLDRAMALAERDQLTGLHNRRYLERYLGSSPTESPVALAALLVDLDGLKAINDTYGHDAGDAAITATADCIRAQTRDWDVLCRVGGDEFLILMPGLTAKAGLVVAQRIAEAVNQAKPQQPWDHVDLSASIGVAMADPSHIPMELLDDALYRVKRSGKGHALLVGDAG